MSIDPADFKPQGRPSVAQMRVVYDSMPRQTIEGLHERLIGLGYEISRATVGRIVKGDFADKPVRIRNMSQKVKRDVAKKERAALDTPADVAKAVMGTMTEADAKRIDDDLNALVGKTDGLSLSEIQEKTRIALNIVLMRQAASRAHTLVLIPRDVAAFVDAMTEAARSSTVASAVMRLQEIPPDDQKMIDVTPERNEVADAIGSFLKQEGVAA